MIKQYKKVLITIFLILAIFININQIKADVILNGDTGSGQNNNNNGNGNGSGCTESYDCGDGVTACCLVNSGSQTYNQVNFNMFDMYGNKINNGTNIISNVLAGTYVSLDVYEKKWYVSWASYSITATKTYYKCTKPNCIQYYTNPDGVIDWSECVQWGAPSVTTSLTGCPGGYSSQKITEPAEACAAATGSCAGKATPPVITLTPSYKVSYKNSNSDDLHNTEKEIEGSSACEGETTVDGNATQKTNTCIFRYNRGDVCINTKTGKIKYLDENDNECKQDEGEYKIEKNGIYWKYFVPLNATSQSGFSFAMQTNRSKQDANICMSIIDNHDNYRDLIIDINENEFPITDTKLISKNRVKERGCYYRTTIKIPVVQKFYNEQSDGKTLKGFNFYYKPIDTNDPFPNGINGTSIWYDWSKSDPKAPDLTKSHNEITYKALNIDTDAVRKYNKNNKYTSWKEMTYKGLSKFIEDEGIVKRENNVVKNIYPLGCGPENTYPKTKDGKTNPLYQKECGNS